MASNEKKVKNINQTGIGMTQMSKTIFTRQKYYIESEIYFNK